MEVGVARLAMVLETLNFTSARTHSRQVRIWDPAERALTRRLAAAASSAAEQPIRIAKPRVKETEV
jgi:hypothetical protein